jgi:hypothetical protein
LCDMIIASVIARRFDRRSAMTRGGRSNTRRRAARGCNLGRLGYLSVSEMNCMVTPVTPRENVSATGARWSVASGRSSRAVECPDSPDECDLSLDSRGRGRASRQLQPSAGEVAPFPARQRSMTVWMG